MYTRIMSARRRPPTDPICQDMIQELPHKSRNCVYPRDRTVTRFPVPDEKMDWSVPYPEYSPVEFTVPKLLATPSPAWADPQPPPGSSPLDMGIKFNSIDGILNRNSHVKKYDVVDGFPLNPMGRTGIRMRGCLGKWGPNHAADSVVTRWKLDEHGNRVLHPQTGKPILQFVTILRRDVNQWACPGGMVDPGESAVETVKREFAEEAMSFITADATVKSRIQENVNRNFLDAVPLYRGYSDDPRNTDNAWMETQALNFHDEVGDGLGSLELNAGDDAQGVQWADMDRSNAYYANHRLFIEGTAKYRGAHW